MQTRLRSKATVRCAAACLGMSSWVACNDDPGSLKSPLEDGTGAGAPAPAGGEAAPPPGAGSGGDGEVSPAAKKPIAGKGGAAGKEAEAGKGAAGKGVAGKGAAGKGAAGKGAAGKGGAGAAGYGGKGGAGGVAGVGGKGGAGGLAGVGGKGGVGGAAGLGGKGGAGGIAGVGGQGAEGGTGGKTARQRPPRIPIVGSPQVGPDGQGVPIPAEGGTAAAGGCGPDLRIRFKAVVGNEDFACGQTYPGQGEANTTITPQDFRLFVQNVALIRVDGERIPITLDVRKPWQADTAALLDFEDQTTPCVGNKKTNTEVTGTIEAGTYRGLSFSNGVPEDVNHADPTTLPDPYKAYLDDLYWPELQGFRFIKAEVLQVDPEGGRGIFHLASTECSGDPLFCAKPNRNIVEIDHFDVCNDVVLVDIGALFHESNLSQQTECLTSGTECPDIFEELGIEYESGLPELGQTVYRKR